MRFKGTIFLNPTIIFIAALAYLSAGFTPDGGWKIYRNQHLGFSLKFPGDLNAEEFPDGVMLVNDKLPGIDRNIIQVQPFHSQTLTTGVPNISTSSETPGQDQCSDKRIWAGEHFARWKT